MSMSANTRVRKRLGDMLVEMGRLTEDDLRMALDRQRKARKPLGEILVSSGLVTQKDLLEALSLQLGVPYADLRTGLVDPKIVDVLPKQAASRYGICPMFKVHDALTVAVSRPLSIFEIDDIEQITSMRLQLVLCSADLVHQAVEKYYGSQVELDVFLDSLEESRVETRAPADQQPNTAPKLVMDFGKDTPADFSVCDFFYKSRDLPQYLVPQNRHLSPASNFFLDPLQEQFENARCGDEAGWMRFTHGAEDDLRFQGVHVCNRRSPQHGYEEAAGKLERMV